MYSYINKELTFREWQVLQEGRAAAGCVKVICWEFSPLQGKRSPAAQDEVDPDGSLDQIMWDDGAPAAPVAPNHGWSPRI